MGIFTDIDKYGSNIAVISQGTEYSYKQLTEDADSLATEIGKRCLVFIICSNSYPSLMGYVACLRNNIVPLMINSSTDTEKLDNLISVYKPAYIWQPKDFLKTEKINISEYELIKCEKPDYEINDELALLLTTSGSTGSPKYVRQSYANIKSNAESIIEYLEILSTDRAITTLPMSYTYGLSIINTHLLMGASLVLTEATLMQKEFWELFKTYKPNNFGGVPYTYEMLKKMRFERTDLSQIRYLTQAGGRLGKELHQEFADIAKNNNFKFVVMYGQTEATARMSWLPPSNTLNKIGSIGIAIPRGQFLLIDVEGNEIKEPNVVGELVYTGNNVTLGYAGSYEELNLGDERQGRLETGDMAYVDEDGYYYIAGRKKRFLKVYGNRVNLDELDGMLSTQGFEAVTAGEDNHVKIFAVNGTEEDIIKFVSEKTGLNRNAFEVKKIAAIPRSESGKILYKELV